MKYFVKKTVLGLFVFLLFIEIFCRLFVDPVYYIATDIYAVKPASFGLKDFYTVNKPKHVDYLFMGSSRVSASINIHALDSLHIVAINAGKGYSTGEIQYYLLSRWVAQNPGFLKNAKVLLEYPDDVPYKEKFNLGKDSAFVPGISSDLNPMPQLLLPVMSFHGLMEFINSSNNNLRMKCQMVLLYGSSFYRVLPYLKEKMKQVLDALYRGKSYNANMAEGGGVKVDLLSVEHAKQQAVIYSETVLKEQKYGSPLTSINLDGSVLFQLNKLIKQYGGTLYMYDMPLHTMQKQLTATDFAKQSRKTFTEWTEKNGIPIIPLDGFQYSDADFPDFWHMSASRQNEFTLGLYKKVAAFASANKTANP